MKVRVISAIVASLIAIPVFLFGGLIFKVGFFLIALLGMREFIHVRERKKEFPIIIKLISYLCLTLFYFGVTINKDMIINFDFRIITSLILILFLPIMIYNNKNKYNINDACQMIGMVLLISFSFVLLNMYRNVGLDLIIYIFMIPIMTDIFALFTGMLIGKHKLTEISPKKTVEGFIGGSLISTFTSTMFYVTVINECANIYLIVLVTLLLSIVGQFGDLFFSSIKRYYKVKDYGNIMPGHGGVLDRFDSMIFVLIAFSLIITLI